MKMNDGRKSIVGGLILFSMMIPSMLFAQVSNVYFIGNSFTYTHGVPGVLSNLAAAGGHTLATKSDVIGGSELKDHWLTGVATNAIANGSYQYVILQENSGLPYTPSIESNFNIYAPLYDTVITNNGARTLLYMPWVRKSALASLTNGISLYRNMAAQLNCKVSPVGEAWRRLLRQYPDIDPYGPDLHHPSEAGAYLAACNFYGVIFNESPEGLPMRTAGGLDLDPADAAVLQSIAWDAVQFVSFTNPPVISSLMVDQPVRTNTDSFAFQVETSGGSDIVDYLWNFGDGIVTNGAALTNVTHIYTTDGVYSVTVKVTGSSGETDRVGLRVVRDVLGPQVPDFSASPVSGEIPLPVQFTDHSTGIITNRIWDFGDGGITNTTGASVLHTYETAGTYTVQLVVCGAAVAVTNIQTNLIQATYTPTRIVYADLADRYVTESDPLVYRVAADTTARVGDNASGQRTTWVIPFPLPAPPGGDPVSEVTLEVYIQGRTSFSTATNVFISILGGRTSASATVMDADVNATTAVLLDKAQIVNENVVGSTPAVYKLDPAFFQRIYDTDPAAVGKFVFITLRTDSIDPWGANSYLTYSAANSAANVPVLRITTAPMPTRFTADPTSGWAPLTVSFTDASTVSGITNRFWDFGDGVTTNTAEITVSHTYTSAGTNTVQLIVSSPDVVSTNTQIAAITVATPVAPSAGFSVSPASGTLPLDVTFTDTSTGTITNRFWDFGDGFTTNTTATTVAHTYDSAGTSTVQLIVSGPAGASTNTQVAAVTVTLPSAPVASFSASPTSGTAPLNVTFTDTSTGSITNRFWDFGDGFTTNTTATTVAHTYTSAGTNTVQLIVSGPLGESTSTQAGAVTVTLPPAPVASFSASPTSGIAPRVVSFTDTSTGTITNRFWSFGDGAITNTSATSLTHTYLSAGTNTALLVVSGPGGASTNSQTILISAAPAPSGSVTRLDISSAFNYDAVATDAERLYGISQTNKQVGDISVLGDHAIASTTTKYAFSYNPNGVANTKGLPTDGMIAGGKYEFAKGLVGAAKYGTVDGTTKVNNAVTTKGSNNAWVTVTLLVDQQQKYSDFNVLMSGRRYATAGKTVTLTAGLEYKYAGDDTWYSVINESVSSSTDKGGALGGRIDNGGSTTPALDGVWSSVAMPASGIASGGGPTSFSSTQTYAFELVTPVALDSTKTLEAIRIKTGTSNASYINEAFLYAMTATLAASPEPGGTDDDSDGIPNDWEAMHFGGSTNAHPNAMAANGVNTLMETYVAGLDPTNAASVFTVSNNWNSLRWNAASGRVYSVYRSTNLLNGFQPLETNIVWPQNSWTGQVNGSQSDFYKVNVQLGNPQ